MITLATGATRALLLQVGESLYKAEWNGARHPGEVYESREREDTDGGFRAGQVARARDHARPCDL